MSGSIAGSHAVGENYEDSYDKLNIFNKTVGKCPEVEVLIEGQPIKCLIDTGSQVSTVTETFFRTLLKEKPQLIDITRWLRVKSANELDVPYIGLIEVSMEVGRNSYTDVGFLVVRDPKDQEGLLRKQKVPGVIGSKFFEIMKEQVKLDKENMHNGTKDHFWSQILSLHETSVSTDDRVSFIKVPGIQPVKISDSQNICLFNESCEWHHKTKDFLFPKHYKMLNFATQKYLNRITVYQNIKRTI